MTEPDAFSPQQSGHGLADQRGPAFSFAEVTPPGATPLRSLYERGKQKQWDADKRVDWSVDPDPENPQEMPDANLPLHGSDLFDRMTAREKASLRRHFQAWHLSQLMHGEQ